MKTYVAVGVGGVVGSLLRYGMTALFVYAGLVDFPWATLVVNVSGAFLLTFLLFHPVIRTRLDETILTGLTVGLIGSYTTFSAITLEIVELAATAQIGWAILYAGLTIIVGLLSSFVGYKVASKGAR